MNDGPVDPNWPRLLGLSVHEFRNPVTVVAGYIRMLLKERVGTLSDQQRRLLSEAEKSCGRLSELIAEMSDLSALEARTAPFNRSPLDLHALLADSIKDLSADPDRNVRVSLTTSSVPTTVDGDPVRLRTAFRSVIHALRRELVASDELFVREQQSEQDGHPVSRIVLADGDRIEALSGTGPEDFGTFDEWRGGCGLTLAIARRVIEAHGGRILSPIVVPRAGALVVLPLLEPASHIGD